MVLNLWWRNKGGDNVKIKTEMLIRVWKSHDEVLIKKYLKMLTDNVRECIRDLPSPETYIYFSRHARESKLRQRVLDVGTVVILIVRLQIAVHENNYKEGDRILFRLYPRTYRKVAYETSLP